MDLKENDKAGLVDSFQSAYEDNTSLYTSIEVDRRSSRGSIRSITRRFESSFDRANEMEVSWHNINVLVKPQKRKWNIFCNTKVEEEPKCILKNVSGKVEPGQLLAIMGASGAGKTTLMNVLTNRNLGSVQVTGEVKANGCVVEKSLSDYSSYVQQDDMFIGTLTVKEHLIFQAMLRMDKHLSYKERMQKVRIAVLELGLSKCVDTKIGIVGEKKGISGGERKRLAFASEVLTNPAVMFCDEPTSGLDSFMSMNVVSVLKKLATGGRTIICTIHQPSSEVYEMFDNVLLMAEGRVAFMGHREDAVPFFEKLGLIIPRNHNPADFFIFNLAVRPGKEEVCRNQISRICEEFNKNHEAKLSSRIGRSNSLPLKVDSTRSKSRYKASWFTQMRALTWRSFLSLKREPQLFRIRFLQTVIISIMLGLIYYQQKLDQTGIMNIGGVMFLMLTNMSFTAMYAVINVFCSELPIFLREHANAMYRVDVYFICKTMADIPFFILLPVVCTSILYWMTGLKPELSAFLICMGNVILVTNVAASFGYMISCASNSVPMALSLSTPFNVPLMLFGGFFLNNASLAVYFSWLKYLSWYFYGYEVMAVNQWRNVHNITCVTSTPCMPNGEVVLASLHFHEDHLCQNLLLLLALIIFYRIWAFIFLFIKSFKQR